MNLPFTTSEFFAVFGRYNDAVWPIQFVFPAAAAIAVFALWKQPRRWGRPVLLLLAFLWVWMGVVYHGIFFRAINPAATAFAVLFVAEGVILLLAATRATVEIRPAFDVAGIAGSVIVFYALVIYPAIGYVLGHRYPHHPTFGLPCPTTLFTIGVLLWATPIRVGLLVVPLLWAVVGSSAALQIGVYEDAGLIVAGAAALVMLVRQRRSRQHTAFSSSH